MAVNTARDTLNSSNYTASIEQYNNQKTYFNDLDDLNNYFLSLTNNESFSDPWINEVGFNIQKIGEIETRYEIILQGERNTDIIDDMFNIPEKGRIGKIKIHGYQTEDSSYEVDIETEFRNGTYELMETSIQELIRHHIP